MGVVSEGTTLGGAGEVVWFADGCFWLWLFNGGSCGEVGTGVDWPLALLLTRKEEVRCSCWGVEARRDSLTDKGCGWEEGPA